MTTHKNFLIAALLFTLAGTASAQSANNVRVDLKETRLANGLRVITVKDHSTSVIAIDITYNVGSRNERPGRTGFAHSQPQRPLVRLECCLELTNISVDLPQWRLIRAQGRDFN